jgi:DNA repair protein RadD
MFVPRPYQNKAVKAGVDFFRSPVKGNALIVIPTGGGKSIVIAETLKELNEPAIITCHSKEILEQNYKKYISYGFKAGIYSASVGIKDIQDVTFVTIGSVVEKPELFSHIKIVLIDEAHGVNSKKDDGMYNRFLKALNNPKTLGFTATPWRLNTDGYGGSQQKFLTRTRPRVFDRMIYYVQASELFEQGFLSPLKYYSIPGFDQDMIKSNSTGADHDEKSINAYYQKINFPASIVRVAESLKKYRKNCLIFTRGISEAYELANSVKGIEVIHAKTKKKDRENILKRFFSGELWGIANVGIMTTGIDFPQLECILVARPTMSLTLYCQMLGRGTRIHPEKENCFIVDMGDNLRLFGTIENMKILNEGNDKWYVASDKGKKLTNEYFER